MLTIEADHIVHLVSLTIEVSTTILWTTWDISGIWTLLNKMENRFLFLYL